EFDDPLELPPLRLGPRILHVARVLQIPAEDLVSERLADTVSGEEPVERCLQLRASLANHPSDVAALVNDDVFVKANPVEDLTPERGDVSVDDYDFDQTRVQHFEEVLVFEYLGRGAENDLGLAALRELTVQPDQVLVVAARLADEDLLAGQILDAGYRGRLWPSDYDFVDFLDDRSAEGNAPCPRGR